MSVTLTYNGIIGVQPFLALNLNIPSGRSALLGSAANGGHVKYAFSDKASISGSAEHFWAHEFSNPATATPGVRSDGWKLALSGMLSF